jgi:glycine oxidase
MSSAFDVIVVGGGVIGNAAAYHLAKAKARVLVLEREAPGGSATRAAAGMLAAQEEAGDDEAFLDFCLKSRDLFKTLVPEVEALAGFGTEWAVTGLWRAAADEAEAASLREKAHRQSERGLPARWLDAAEARAALPSIEAPHGAFLAPEDGLINPVLWSRALAEAARRLGARYAEFTPALSFLRDGRRVTGVRADRSAHAAGHVLLSAGAWTPGLLDGLDLRLPLEPVKGQLMVLSGAPGLLPAPVYAGDGYVVPRRDGRVLVGATAERVGFDTRPTPAAQARLAAWAARWSPALLKLPVVGLQAGLRPASADGKPLLGPAPGWDGVSLACGHHRNGILLSALSGRIAAEGALEGRWQEARGYAPDRFVAAGATA